ncbi:hypothetical protein [Sorangium cellulosum]|uniref:hypothetical protein n=1 Tax=Sorangium cellulosum TaxID=56 RepID=UPI0002E67F8E|nr:hypothetical protein [Sorangium cellulosum]
MWRGTPKWRASPSAEKVLGKIEAERRRLVGEVRASSPRVIGLLRGLLPEMAAWLDAR